MDKKLWIFTSALAFICFIFATYLVIKGDSNSYYAVYCGGAACFGGSMYYYKRLKDAEKKDK